MPPAARNPHFLWLSHRFERSRRGSLALSAILALVLLMVVVLGMATLSMAVLRSGSHTARVRSLQNLAESGIQYGYWQYAYNYAPLPYSTTRSFGPGQFSVAVTDNSANLSGTVLIVSAARLNADALTAQRIVASVARPIYAVASGSSSGAQWFTADSCYSGGYTYSTGSPIDVSQVSRPAPQQVYQVERFGNYTYTFTSLKVSSPYKIRLHFAEIYWFSAGQRIFNVIINGTQVLSNFDIFQAAGGSNIALVKEYTMLSDSSGTITIQMVTIKDNAKTSGVEITPAS